MTSQSRWSARWLKLAVLVVMMLATIGAWEVFKGAAKFTGYAHADFADHLTCYKVNADNGDPKLVAKVFDQFFRNGLLVKVKHLELLCTPAIKQIQ